MAQYIDKSDIVAEIEELYDEWKWYCSTEAKYRCESYTELLSFLDTLEVKEIGIDLGDPKGDIGVKTVWDSSNSLEISRNGNSHNGETLEEAAKNHKSAIHIVSPQWTSEVEKAFKAGAQWQKEQMIDKACNFLHHYQEYPNHDIATGSLIEAFKMFIEL